MVDAADFDFVICILPVLPGSGAVIFDPGHGLVLIFYREGCEKKVCISFGVVALRSFVDKLKFCDVID